MNGRRVVRKGSAAIWFLLSIVWPPIPKASRLAIRESSPLGLAEAQGARCRAIRLAGPHCFVAARASARLAATAR